MSTRRRWTLLLIVFIVAALVIATVMFSGGSKDEEPTSAFDPSVPKSSHTPPPPDSTTPSAAPTDAPTDGADPDEPSAGTASPTDPTPAPTPQQRAEISAGTSEVLVAVLDETAEIDPSSPTDVVGDLSNVASQAYLSELESERLEFEAEGWTRAGSYSLGEVEVLDHSSTSDGEVATVRVCVDSSGLVTRRADGEVLETSPSSARAWNIFVLERTDSADWRIVGRSFPDNPAC